MCVSSAAKDVKIIEDEGQKQVNKQKNNVNFVFSAVPESYKVEGRRKNGAKVL